MSYGETILEQFLNLLIPMPHAINHRPEWLRGLELDFYFEPIRLAIEFQGDHHYKTTNYSSDPGSVRKRDWIKRDLCLKWGVILIAVDPGELSFSHLARKFREFMPIKRAQVLAAHSQQIEAITSQAKLYRLTLKSNFSSVASSRRNRLRL